MLNNILKTITHISDKQEINSSNYLEGIGYVDSVYRFMSTMQLFFKKDELEFKPSFYGEVTSEKYNIPYTDVKETEMKVFKITSPLFSEDNMEEYKEKIAEKLGSVSSITVDNLVLIIILN